MSKLSATPPTNTTPTTAAAATLEEVQLRRSERKASRRKARDAQHARDIEALDLLEVEHGDGRVYSLATDAGGDRWIEGLPTLVILRTPSLPEMKRYRARVKPKNERDRPDLVAAAEELAAACRLYPPTEDYDALGAALPGLHAQAGTLCVRAALGREEEEGKD